MIKSVIDKMNKEEVLELLSPFLHNGGRSYYEVLSKYQTKLRLEDDDRYSHGRLDVSVNMFEFSGKDEWVNIGSVGSAIYSDILVKYREMTINKIIQ